MNYMNILNNILLALSATIFSSLIFPVGDILTIVVMFLATFVLFSLFRWFISSIKPAVVTKDSDEIVHPVTQLENTLHAVNLQKHYGKKYNPKLLETCSCGSTLFRIYNEDTDKGTYIQLICVKCNQKATGLEFNWK